MGKAHRPTTHRAGCSVAKNTKLADNSAQGVGTAASSAALASERILGYGARRMGKAKPDQELAGHPSTLGRHLANLRQTKGLTLRQVEEQTQGEVSNAYLSQVEHGKIASPSPNVLHSLSQVYGVPYGDLMERAGYVQPTASRADSAKHGRVPTFAQKNLTREEEDALLEYLAFLRSRPGTRR